jgi:hypothetical protein
MFQCRFLSHVYFEPVGIRNQVGLQLAILATKMLGYDDQSQ